MAKQLSSFEKAFAAARKDKQKEFTWNNKKYTTEYKEEKVAREAKEKTASTPANKNTGTPASTNKNTGAPAPASRNTGAPAVAAPRNAPTGGSLLMDRPEYAASRAQAKVNQAAAKKAEEKAKADREASIKAERESRAAALKGSPEKIATSLLERKRKEAEDRKKEEAEAAKRESDRLFAQIEAGRNRGSMMTNYAKGGKVSSASKRADGIAIRGKTRAR